ncbi:LuxR family transcriptional regulator [Ferrimonas sp. SCSIO 43195]|uniref:helix-turn-helix transcriptional regulator n=1 Tax=Ferrimonas sp. SCSIO 43195 TaxID=2822844 RepID=UPI002075FCAA|nr:LuxR family transcriptional regulator [Ferrimonas sp. SCSIO 43195]USD36104.1 LuxR family transcriptional regulator [Ferrimonas sp. SCSIO 43195]
MSTVLTQKCPIDGDHLQRASAYLAQFGITHFFYGITTKVMIPSLHQFKKLRRRLPQEMIQAKCGVYSSDAILTFRHHYLQHFAATDEAYFNKHPLGLSVWQDPDLSGAKGEQFARLLEDYQIRSRGVWHLPIRQHPDWLAAFVFFSDLDRATLLANLSANEADIGHHLALYAALFNEQCIARLNPIANFSCLSERALAILRLTAEGNSSEEVAEQLSLTESGVNYHLDRIKELLNARNRAQLISMAHTMGLLD